MKTHILSDFDKTFLFLISVVDVDKVCCGLLPLPLHFHLFIPENCTHFSEESLPIQCQSLKIWLPCKLSAFIPCRLYKATTVVVNTWLVFILPTFCKTSRIVRLLEKVDGLIYAWGNILVNVLAIEIITHASQQLCVDKMSECWPQHLPAVPGYLRDKLIFNAAHLHPISLTTRVQCSPLEKTKRSDLTTMQSWKDFLYKACWRRAFWFTLQVRSQNTFITKSNKVGSKKENSCLNRGSKCLNYAPF